MAQELNDKQKLFAEEYLKDLHITKAATRAGYSEKSAHVQGHELLKNPKIQAYVQKLMDRRSRRTEITRDNVLIELAKLAFVNVKDLFTNDGKLKPISELPDDVAGAISGIDVGVVKTIRGDQVTTEMSVAKIRFWDKRGSLELLGKHLQLFTKKVGGEEKEVLDPEFL